MSWRGFSTYILIHGAMFRTADKAPFTVSGESILGALEYNPQTDEVKCHKCGSWHTGLYQHIRHEHDESAFDYRDRHGLTRATALCGLKHSKERKERAARMATVQIPKILAAKRIVHSGPTKKHVYQETLNLRKTCAAQILERLKDLSEDLGRTPTHKEIREAGLSIQAFVTCYGSLPQAMQKIGLEARTLHSPKGSSLYGVAV